MSSTFRYLPGRCRRLSMKIVLVGCTLPTFFALTGCAGVGDTSNPVNPVTAPGNITVSKTQPYLLKDGAVWTSHGFVIVAFEAAPTSTKLRPYSIAAQANYNSQGVAYFSTIKTWGADTVRMMVCQPALDPMSSLYSQAYVTNLVAAVQGARKAGLTVIVNLQDQAGDSGSLTQNQPFVPNDASTRAWMQLTPFFNTDQGIVYEIFNEPYTSDMNLWQSSMNNLISVIRQTGSTNAIVADGNMNNLYTVTDPAANPAIVATPDLTDSGHNLAYAMHPYLNVLDDQLSSTWDSRFGNFALTHAVIITEWFPGNNTYFCDNTPAVDSQGITVPSTAQATVNLYAYLQGRHIGFDAFAFDFPSISSSPVKISGTIASDFNGATLTTFQQIPGSSGSTQCGQQYFGPGQTIKDWYTTGVVPASPI